MTNRILLNSSGLKISKPGYDVLTAPLIGLSFSSDWKALNIVQQAEFGVSWSDLGSGILKYNFAFSIGTFPSPPMVLFERKMASGGYAPLGMGGFYMGSYKLPGSPAPYWHLAAYVTNTQIPIAGFINKSADSGLPVPSIVLRYTILQYDM